MAVDLLTEAARIVEAQMIDRSLSLSRRHRCKPLSFAIAGDDASVLFGLKRRRQGISLMIVRVTRTNAEWRSVSVSSCDRLPTTALPDRPSALPPKGGTSWAPRVQSSWGSGTRVQVVLLLSREVDSIRVDRAPPVVVPDHGFVVLLCRGPRSRIEAFDAAGHSLGSRRASLEPPKGTARQLGGRLLGRGPRVIRPR